MVTDGLNAFTVVRFAGAVLAGFALATGLRLILRNADLEAAFIIGHENSLLHRKTTFRLPG